MSTSELIEYLEDRVGEDLRGVVRYSDHTNDVKYLREDIREERLRSQIDRMLDRIQPESSSREERSFPFGDLYVTMRRFEEAVVLHFPTGSNRGVVVTFEPKIASNFAAFTDACYDRIQD